MDSSNCGECNSGYGVPYSFSSGGVNVDTVGDVFVSMSITVDGGGGGGL